MMNKRKKIIYIEERCQNKNPLIQAEEREVLFSDIIFVIREKFGFKNNCLVDATDIIKHWNFSYTGLTKQSNDCILAIFKKFHE